MKRGRLLREKEVIYDGKSRFVTQVDFLMCCEAYSNVFLMSEVAAAHVCLNACLRRVICLNGRNYAKGKTVQKK